MVEVKRSICGEFFHHFRRHIFETIVNQFAKRLRFFFCGDLTVEFAYHLSQLYRVVDGMGGNPSALAMIMQFAVYGTEMDAYMADGPPIIVQKAMRSLLAPTARLLGYKSYYEEYRMVHQPS
jgi:hypothetical protein